eukprot:248019_1
MMLRSFAFVSAAAVLTSQSASAVELPMPGLRNFLGQTETAKVEEGGSCNPTGNGADEQGCDKGYYCDLGMVGTCPDLDVEQSGTCTRVTFACNRMYRRTCACDGKVYSNSCTAYGLNVKNMGMCTSAASVDEEEDAE